MNLRVGRPVSEAKAEGHFDRVISGKHQRAAVTLRLRHAAEGKNTASLGYDTTQVPETMNAAVLGGCREAFDAGPLAGYSVVGVEAVAIEVLYDEDNSTDLAFKSATSQAFREAYLQAKPTLLEPVMLVEVVTPEENMGDVMGDLTGRRADIREMKASAGRTQTIKALVPLANMFGYSTTLRSLSQGRATYTMQPDRYDPVPEERQAEILGRVP